MANNNYRVLISRPECPRPPFPTAECSWATHRDRQCCCRDSGSEIFAIGATCTHYSGPLGEGLIVGDTVRCPWHHACFSLRTGEAIRAPALSPVSRWTVERRGDTVSVTNEIKPVDGATPLAGAPTAAPPPDVKRVVIVGAGVAGNAAAEMLRRRGFGGTITMLGADPATPYDRPNLSKDYLAGTAEESWLPLHSTSILQEARHRAAHRHACQVR